MFQLTEESCGEESGKIKLSSAKLQGIYEIVLVARKITLILKHPANERLFAAEPLRDAAIFELLSALKCTIHFLIRERASQTPSSLSLSSF